MLALLSEPVASATSVAAGIAVTHPGGRTKLHAHLQPGDELDVRGAPPAQTEIVIRRHQGEVEVLMAVPSHLAQRHMAVTRNAILSIPPRTRWRWPMAAAAVLLLIVATSTLRLRAALQDAVRHSATPETAAAPAALPQAPFPDSAAAPASPPAVASLSSTMPEGASCPL
jgi:hypothetical protein